MQTRADREPRGSAGLLLQGRRGHTTGCLKTGPPSGAYQIGLTDQGDYFPLTLFLSQHSLSASTSSTSSILFHPRNFPTLLRLEVRAFPSFFSPSTRFFECVSNRPSSSANQVPSTRPHFPPTTRKRHHFSISQPPSLHSRGDPAAEHLTESTVPLKNNIPHSQASCQRSILYKLSIAHLSPSAVSPEPRPKWSGIRKL